MSKSFLKEYGKTILNLDMIQCRKYFTWNIDLTSQKDIETFIKSLLNIDSNIKIMLDIRKKEFGIGFRNNELDWHLDDHQLVKLKTKPSYNQHLYRYISGNKYLYCSNDYGRLSNFTIIFYESTQGIDFEGGELLLVDDTKIIPRENEGILLDSREIHSVLPVKKGIRISTIVKVFITPTEKKNENSKQSI